MIIIVHISTVYLSPGGLCHWSPRSLSGQGIYVYMFVCVYKTPSHEDDRIVGYIKPELGTTKEENRMYSKRSPVLPDTSLKASLTPYFFFYCPNQNRRRTKLYVQ